MTGDEAGYVKTPEAGRPTGRGQVTPGSLPYLTLAEIGYFGQVALLVVDFVLIAATMSMDYSRSVPSIAVGTLLVLVISVAWFQLGRKGRNSWFLATGIGGAVSALLGLALSLGPETNPSGFYLVVVEIVALATLIYFVMQVSAFFSAARTFQVRLFRYAGYLYVMSFVVTFAVGMVGAIVVVSGPSQIQSGATLATYGVDYAFSGMTSVAAGLGFRRARGIVGLSGFSELRPSGFGDRAGEPASSSAL